MNSTIYLFCVNGYKQCTRKCCKVETDWEIPKFANFSNMFMLSILLSVGLWSIQMELTTLTWYTLVNLIWSITEALLEFTQFVLTVNIACLWNFLTICVFNQTFLSKNKPTAFFLFILLSLYELERNSRNVQYRGLWTQAMF